MVLAIAKVFTTGIIQAAQEFISSDRPLPSNK